jgi:hypothetical protein
MALLKTPGLQFYADQIDPLYPPTGLYPTMSTYGILDLEGGPKRNELYVVCKDGSIQSVHNPSRPIGWELIEDGDEWFYRVTQMNHPRKRCAVRYHSRVANPPEGRGRIGSIVTFERRIETPQNAEVTEQKDDGAEVTSALREYLDRFQAAAAAVDTTKLTGDEAKIATINPLLAQCAVILDDPVQTEAMARFAEGKMSYAEMRSMCG